MALGLDLFRSPGQVWQFRKRKALSTDHAATVAVLRGPGPADVCFETQPPGGSGAHSARTVFPLPCPESRPWPVLGSAGTATHRSATVRATSLECLGGWGSLKLKQRPGSPLASSRGLGDSKGPEKVPGVALDRNKQLRLGVWEAEPLFP